MQSHTYKLAFDAAARRGRIEVFDQADNCVASRVIEDSLALPGILDDLQPLLALDADAKLSIGATLSLYGLPARRKPQAR